MPFAPGQLFDDAELGVRSDAGDEVPVHVVTLARWPADGSIRSALVAFRAVLPPGAVRTFQVVYGTPRAAAPIAALSPNPDGPVAATLPAAWYSASRVSGLLVPVAENQRFKEFDSILASHFAQINYNQFGNNCGSTTSHRTYYDGPHALYQRFLRTGDPVHYRRAREEALWYRANELRWFDGESMAIQNCQGSNWNPSIGLDWSVLRRMLSQGMLDDHLLTGDAAAAKAVRGLGEAYRRNLPALTSGGANSSIEATERNLAWTMMGLAGYYALDTSDSVKSALRALADRAIAWQARGASGAFEHDVERPDPLECSNGPNGASPFMTSLLVDGLMDYHQLTGDPRVADSLRKLATWYRDQAITSDGKAFRYLWNCLNDPYDDSDTADLNLLIAHVFGATYALTGDAQWIAFGDRMADSGVENMFAKRPKQWNQSSRSFGKYLGYRSSGAAK